MEATASAAKAGRPNQNLPAALFGGLARHSVWRACPPSSKSAVRWLLQLTTNDQQPTQNSTLKTQNSAFGDQILLPQNPHSKTPSGRASSI